MDLVHNINTLPHISGRIDCFIPQGTDLIHAVIGRRIQFQHIQKASALNACAGGTLTTGITIHRLFAVNCLG